MRLGIKIFRYLIGCGRVDFLLPGDRLQVLSGVIPPPGTIGVNSGAADPSFARPIAQEILLAGQHRMAMIGQRKSLIQKFPGSLIDPWRKPDSLTTNFMNQGQIGVNQAL